MIEANSTGHDQKPRSATSDLVLQCLPMFTDNPLYSTLCHSNKDRAALNNRYLDVVQTRDLISLVNGYHADKNLKERFGLRMPLLNCKQSTQKLRS